VPRRWSLRRLPRPSGSRLSRPARDGEWPLALKLGIALVGLVTLVLLVNGAVNLWLNYEEAKRAAVSVQQEKAQAAAERVDAFISDVENQIGWTLQRHPPPLSAGCSSGMTSSACCGRRLP
jgi:hypothetical protein